MNPLIKLPISFRIITVLLLFVLVPSQLPGDEFTYQGKLQDAGAAVNSACDFRFELYNAASGGVQVGSTVTLLNVTVEDGVFTVSLDFGADAFDGSDRWLAIEVRCPAGGGNYTALSPRQPITSAPRASSLSLPATLAGVDSRQILEVDNSDTTIDAAAVRGRMETFGTAGWRAAGIKGESSGGNSGAYNTAVFGENTGDLGPYNVGVGAVAYGGHARGMQGEVAQGQLAVGVLGWATSDPDGTSAGIEGRGAGPGSGALRVTSGQIQITGAGVATMTPAFVHHATTNNIIANFTVIDNPMCNDRPDAILFTTHNWNPPGLPGIYNDRATGVFYISSSGRWAIFNEDSAPFPVDCCYNVLIINPSPAGAGFTGGQESAVLDQ